MHKHIRHSSVASELPAAPPFCKDSSGKLFIVECKSRHAHGFQTWKVVSPGRVSALASVEVTRGMKVGRQEKVMPLDDGSQ